MAGLLAALGLLSAAPAAAETEGRVSFTNVFTRMTGPEATLDAGLFRVWLRSENIGGKNVSFYLDGRSDIVLAETEVRFNSYCRGKLDDPDCRDGAVRNVALGQLAHLAGFYDAHVQFGARAPDRLAFSIGRKTIYEAGLVTVDGINVERGFDRSRVGVFAGLAPDPLTRMVSADYATAGGYWAYQGMSRWIRIGGSGQAWLGKEEDAEKTGLDRATLFNQNFFKISPSFSVASFAQIDVVPGPEERLVYVDLTYKPSGRYRLRFNATRYRPVAFELSPAIINGLPADVIVSDFDAARTTGPLASVYANLPWGRRPEVLEDGKLTSAVTLGKVVAHYVTANSITPYVSATYRMRDIDGKSGILASVGAYTYDPYSSGITARARFQFDQGFDHDALRLGGWLEREMTRTVVLGGGFDVAQVKYKGHDPLANFGYPKSADVGLVFLQARYDRPSGISLFAEGQYYNQLRKRSANEPVPTTGGVRPTESSSEMTALGGITWRF